MILHLGGETTIQKKEILMILDYEEAVRNRDTGFFLKNIETDDVSGGKPKSIVIVTKDGKQRAILSAISSRTLLKRADLFA